ncbi:MAG: class I SAM-dependent methyltransferase, partial [Pseudomonadota bacterium]
ALGRGDDVKVHDLTAGFGGDLVLLVAAGFEVRAVEKNPLVYCLLKDAVDRWIQRIDDPSQLPSQFKIPNRVRDAVHAIQVFNEDSVNYLQSLQAEDKGVLYLDPMFEEKRGARLSQGPMQWMQKLVPHSQDEAVSLVNAALALPSRRVVVKRALKAEPFAGPLTHSFSGTSVRYDMYST